MQKFILLTLLFITTIAKAQKGDMVVIKKGKVTIKMMMAGSMANFQVGGGEWFSSRIERIANDSIFFREVIVRQVGTPWGVPKLDTMTTYIRSIHYKDITAIPRQRGSLGFVKNGALFMLAGGGYTVLNLVNSAYLKYAPFGKDNLPNLLTGTGIFATGYLLNRLHKPYLPMGKKYKVEYLQMASR